ncbi:MAG TPA: M56 family metallopeptidase [Terriglobales bacterium]|nr:M56 family metallopeptidase [Terriglobales bacterium]
MSHVLSNLHDLAPLFCQQLVNGVVEGMALALLAWAWLRLIGKQSSGLRFAAWFSVLLFVAAVPFLGLRSESGLSGLGPSVSALRLPESWAFYGLGIWTVISTVALARLGFGLWQLGCLRRNSAIVAADNLDPLLTGCLKEFRKTRPVELRVSQRVNVPMAIGFFRPAIILPKWVLQELSAEDVHAVLLHELAHLRRLDDWTNLLQKVLRAVLFFHPAVWWIESKLALEREMACDEMVLARTGNARGYAQCLVSLAEKSFLHKGLALAQAAVSRMRHMTVRVSQILTGRNTQKARAWKPVIGMAGMFAVVVLVSPHAPRLVTFENSPSDRAVLAQAQLAGAAQNRGEIAGEILEGGARVVPAEFKVPVAASVSLASAHRKPIHHPAVVTAAKNATERQGAVVPVSAIGEAAIPVLHEAVFVVVQPTMDARGFSDGWDVYVIRLTLPSQSASPSNAGTFKKT